MLKKAPTVFRTATTNMLSYKNAFVNSFFKNQGARREDMPPYILIIRQT